MLEQGVDSGYYFPIELPEGVTLDGYSAKCQVRAKESPTSALLHEMQTAIFEDGVAITWTTEESLAWTWLQGYCDVILIDPLDRPRQFLWKGKVKVDKAVTKWEA